MWGLQANVFVPTQTLSAHPPSPVPHGLWHDLCFSLECPGGLFRLAYLQLLLARPQGLALTSWTSGDLLVSASTQPSGSPRPGKRHLVTCCVTHACGFYLSPASVLLLSPRR